MSSRFSVWRIRVNTSARGDKVYDTVSERLSVTATDELVIATVTSNLHGYVAPIEAASGETGVRAFVFACGSCDNEVDRIVTYQSLTAEGIALALQSQIDFETGEHLLAASIVSADGDTWTPLQSEEGRAILAPPIRKMRTADGVLSMTVAVTARGVATLPRPA